MLLSRTIGGNLGTFRGLILLISCHFCFELSAGVCSVVFETIAHVTGWQRRPDKSISASNLEKYNRIEQFLPRMGSNSPELARVVSAHISELSPDNIQRQINEQPREGFWARRAKAELLHLKTLLDVNGLTHPRMIERYIALTSVFFKDRKSVTSFDSIENLKFSARSPNSMTALGVMLKVGGVAPSPLGEGRSADIPLLFHEQKIAEEILGIGLQHPNAEVRSVARRGLLRFSFLNGRKHLIYSERERVDLVAPMHALRRQAPLPGNPELQTAAKLSRLELGRLSTHTLSEILSHEQDAGAASYGLTENRTAAELAAFLTSGNWEIRHAAVLGMDGRYDFLFNGKRTEHVLQDLIEKDPHDQVRLAAIEVLANRPDGTRLLEELFQKTKIEHQTRFSPQVANALEKGLMKNKSLPPQVPDNEILSRIHLNAVPPLVIGADLSRKSLGILRACLQSNILVLQINAVRALKGRTDQESMELLAELMGIPTTSNPNTALNGTHFFAEVREEVLRVVKDRNHPLADEIFERALTFDPSSQVYRTAIRLSTELNQDSKQQGLSHFRVVARSLIDKIEKVQQLASPNDLSVEEKRMDNHSLLLDAAHNSYALPSLNLFEKDSAPANETREQRVSRIADGMVKKRKLFLQGLPLGYKIHSDVGDATTSGLKLYMLRPDEFNPDRPSIISIAGSEKAIDWWGNVTWGSLKRKSPAYQKLLGQVILELMEGRKVQITGHSLGGGMAQYLAYDAILGYKTAVKDTPSLRHQFETAINNLEVVTYNAFGVTQVIRRDKGTFDSDVLKKVGERTTHYRAPWDIVSKLGEPIGKTVKVPYTGWWGTVEAHGLPNLQQAGVTLGGFESGNPFRQLIHFKPFSNTLANWLAPYGNRRIDEYFITHIEEHFDILLEARKKWCEANYEDSAKGDNWLETEISEIIQRAREKSPLLGRELEKKWSEFRLHHKN